ncbi:hypothetical protein QBC39DRAFT_167138 [Podospora conica]|nr:hypothetical protein QBC39DRAFT_167138 [Schizothecium conicum]
MDDISRMSVSDIDVEFDDVAVIDDDSISTTTGPGPVPATTRPTLTKVRSLSDATAPVLSPSPQIYESARPKAKDDIGIRDKNREPQPALPSTPIRAGFAVRGLALHMPQRDPSPARHHPYGHNAPLSPKLDHSHTYASPNNILPRRSRGLDFSRAATSLHHSTLAEPVSPSSSPTVGSRAVNIPTRRPGEFGTAEQSSNSLWSMMGNQEKMHVSSSLGSNAHVMSDTSSSSDDDDDMDFDMAEEYVATPQASRLGPNVPWMPAGSPAPNPMSFQHRQRIRKQHKRKARPLGLGFHSPASGAALSRSPPGNKEMSAFHARRESISWAANQLNISGNESDDSPRQLDGVESPLRRGVIRRAVTRRGNMLPKPKGFARIRAALMEESAPVDTEVRREAEVVKQVMESDLDLGLRICSSAASSPRLGAHDTMDEFADDAMMVDSSSSGNGPHNPISGQLRKPVPPGKLFWNALSDGTAPRITPPPPSFGLTRGSSAGLSMDEMSMDSPATSSHSQSQNPFLLPGGAMTTTSSSGTGTPQAPASQTIPSATAANAAPGGGQKLPTAAEITQRINSKRRRDDDFEIGCFKRRAVSPSVGSAHNSPVMQSPLQRDLAPWGSRPGSVGGDTVGRSGSGSESGNAAERGRIGGGKVRIGLQGMMDTNDGITRLSIE